MKDLFKQYHIRHFTNQPDKHIDFALLRFDDMEEPDVDEIHKHAFYEIIWTEKGKSRQTIDYKQYEVLPNSLFFISPNQVHQFEEWKPLTGGTILFTGDFFLLNHNNKNKLFELTFLDNFYSNPCIQFSKREFAEIKHTIDLMYKEQKRAKKSSTIMQLLLHILLAQVQRSIDSCTERVTPKKYVVLYKEFASLLGEQFEENQSARFYARQLNITQHHLNLVVKSVTGKTAGEVIRARSILEAKRLLTFSDRSIAEISTQLNYFDSSYFAKRFKAETGKSPVDFKKEMSEKYRIR